MIFSKKKNLSIEEENEKLLKECDKLYHDFRSYKHLAHSASYHEFKELLDLNMKSSITLLASINDSATLNRVTKHLHKQLTFINDYPFSVEMAKFDSFMLENFPYQEKIEALLNPVPDNTKKHRI